MESPPDLNPILNDKKLQISFLIFASLLIFLGRQLDTGITIYDDIYYAQKASVYKLIAAVAVTKRYPPSHPIWAETEEDCRKYGLCEFQLESTRGAVMQSYSETWSACNMH